MSAARSGHSSILFVQNLSGPKLTRPFRFFNTWFRDESSLELIKNTWHVKKKDSCDHFNEALPDLRKKQTRWNTTTFGKIKNKISKVGNDLEQVRSMNPSLENTNKETARLELHVREEDM